MVATRNLDGKQEKAESRGEWGGGKHPQNERANQNASVYKEEAVLRHRAKNIFPYIGNLPGRAATCPSRITTIVCYGNIIIRSIILWVFY